ncbi:MAG: GNAT family N-acetyltransferase [Caldilineaceae bacterium]
MPAALEIRNMTRAEVDELVAWAAAEGWNPGLHDAGAFWATDPDAFIAAEVDGALVGGGAITSYAGDFGFMGFFIVRPEYRGRGLGNALWHARRARLLARLHPGATIGLDGVFDMQAYYAKGGFVFSHRNMRFRAEIPPQPDGADDAAPGIVPLADVPWDELVAYDRTCFPAARPAFLRAWLALPDALALALPARRRLRGYGVIRRCGGGCKIGPLFADGAAAAGRFTHTPGPVCGPAALFLGARIIPRPWTWSGASGTRWSRFSAVRACTWDRRPTWPITASSASPPSSWADDRPRSRRVRRPTTPSPLAR